MLQKGAVLTFITPAQNAADRRGAAALSPRAKKELEELQGAFSQFKEKFNRGIALQATIGISNLESKLRTLGECLYVFETFINTIPFSPRQRR